MSDIKLDLPYVASIPYNVQIDNSICDGAKLYFGQLHALTVKFGYCWATDFQLAQMKGVSIRTIERWNKELDDAGHINRVTKNYPVKTESGWCWIPKRKIYTNAAWLARHPKDQEKANSNFESETACEGVAIDTATPCAPIDTATDKGRIESSKESILKQQPKPPAEAEMQSVVISPSLDKLDIPEMLAKKISFENDEPAIQLAVERCLGWKGRPSDEVGIMTTLRDAEIWNDNNKEKQIESAKDFLRSLSKYDGKIIYNTKINIYTNFIEFVCGMKCVVFELDKPDFKRSVNEYLEYLKRGEEDNNK